MIMDLPEKFSIGDPKQKNDAFVENGVLKIRRTASFRFVIYRLTFLTKGGRHKCQYCGKKIKKQKATIDHMYPQDMGGPTITNNLLPACQKCNTTKTNMTVEEFNQYLNIEGVEERKKFMKDLMRKKEELRQKHEYQIPKEWICERKISTLFVELRLKDSTQTNKYKKVQLFYKQYGYFQKPIVIDKNGFLLDGFYTVMYAKDNNIETLPAIQLENVEVIF